MRRVRARDFTVCGCQAVESQTVNLANIATIKFSPIGQFPLDKHTENP